MLRGAGLLCERLVNSGRPSKRKMPGLCHLKDALGVPGQGVHALRIPGTNAAAVDVLLSLGLVWFLAAVPKVPMTLAFLLVFGLALIAHLLFCVPTSSTRPFGLR